MRNKVLSFSVFFFIISCATVENASHVEGVTTVKRSSSSQLRPFTEHTLSNGLHVLLVKDDSLPSVSYQMLVKTGSVSDPPQKSGLSLMVASLLEKGTQKKNATQLAEDLALIGGSFSANVESDFVFLSSSGLSMYQDKLLDLFVEIVTKPSFADVEVERIRKQVLTAITQTVDNPSAFSEQSFNEFLFGTHPYGRSPVGRKKDVIGIRRGSLIRQYLQYYRPNNSILAIVGNYTPDILQRLETSLKTWRARNIKTEVIEKINSVAKFEVRLVNKSDLTQAQIRLGQEGIPRTHADYLALRLANTILGQGFSSRLVDEVRDNLGLTYHISSELDAQQLGGSFEIGTFTRNEKVGEALKKILSILDSFAKDGVKQQEVEAAKGFLIGNFGRSVETADKLAFNLLVLRAYGIPDTYLTKFESNIDALSVGDINRSLRSVLHPDRLKVLVFASQNQVMSQLSNFSSVEVKQVSEVQ